jgi:hypothetical protein
MEKNIQLMRNYIEIKNKLEEVDKKKNPTILDHIFRHEAGNLMMIESIRDLKKIGEDIDEIFKNYYKRAKSTIPKIKRFIPLTNYPEFTKEYLTSNYSNLQEILTEEQKVSETYNIPINIYGNIPTSIPIKEEALSAFISTNIGDAIKWTPKGHSIKIKIKDLGDKLKLSIENKFGKEPIRNEIGMGKKLGHNTQNYSQKH